MKLKFTTSFIIFMICVNVVFSQTAYHFKYNFNDADNTDYTALLVRYNNGSSELRVKYTNASGSPVTNKMMVDEYVGTDASGIEDPNVLFVKASEPQTLNGSPVSGITTPFFIFKTDPQTGFPEPAGLALSADKPELNTNASFTSEFISTIWRNKNVTEPYFDKVADADFYKNNFGITVRGGPVLEMTPAEKKMNVRMHLIIVCDTFDKKIGPDCKLDQQRAYQSFDTIRKYIGISNSNFKVKILQGWWFNKKSVLDSINAIKALPNDIIVFYYSGHGFRVNKSDSFPRLFLKVNAADSIDAVNNSLMMIDIFKKIKDKGARCNLVLSDCCNINLESRKDTASMPKKRGIDRWDFFADNIRALFLSKERISILATAAKNGEKSWSDPRVGGFFSKCFKSTLQDYTSKAKTNVTWKDFMTDLKKASQDYAGQRCCDCCKRQSTCPRTNCKQNPVFMIVKGR